MKYQTKKAKNYSDIKSGKTKKTMVTQKEEVNNSVTKLAQYINIIKDPPSESEEATSDVEERTPSELNTLGKETSLPQWNISIHASLQDLNISPSQRNLAKTPTNYQPGLPVPSFRRSPTLASTFPKPSSDHAQKTRGITSEEKKANSSDLHESQSNFQTTPGVKPDVIQIDFQGTHSLPNSIADKPRLGNVSLSVQDLARVSEEHESKFGKRKKTIQSGKIELLDQNWKI